MRKRKASATPMVATAIAQGRRNPSCCSQVVGILIPTAISAAAKPMSNVARACQAPTASKIITKSARKRCKKARKVIPFPHLCSALFENQRFHRTKTSLLKATAVLLLIT